MIPFFITLLLICPIDALFKNIDQIYFHTSFSCRYTVRPVYIYSILFFEDDLGYDHDMTYWIENQKMISGGAKTNVIYNATIDGDWGWEYEFAARIKHNCMLTGKDVSVEVFFTENYCEKGKGDCHVHISIDLTGLLEASERQVRIEQKAN